MSIETKFKTITPKMVLTQLYKSRDVMTIVMFRNVQLEDTEPVEAYCNKLTKLVNIISKNYNNIEEIPPAKYIEPIIHLNDIHHYLSVNRDVFDSKREQVIVDRILSLIQNTKKELEKQLS